MAVKQGKWGSPNLRIKDNHLGPADPTGPGKKPDTKHAKFSG